MHSELVIPFEKGKTLSCVLTTPAAKASPVGIVLAHGAGGDLHSGNLARFAESFAGAGFLCLRFTCKPTQLPYRVKACQAIINGAVEVPQMQHVAAWIFAGHSMGARVASAMAAANPITALACIFFSYPLHTPGNQDNLRDTPLVDLLVPLLFVHGSKDSMCEADIFAAVRKQISSADLQVHEVENGDHGLKVHSGKHSRSQTEDALKAVSAAVSNFACTIEQKYLKDCKTDEAHEASVHAHNRQTNSGLKGKDSSSKRGRAIGASLKSKKAKVK